MAKGEKKSSVERLKNRLYDRGAVGKEIKEERSTLSPSDAEPPRTWADAEPIKPPLAPEPTPQPKPVAPPHMPSSIPGVVEAEIIPDTPEVVVEPEPRPKRHMTFATKFFLGSMAFFFAALGVSAILFFGGVNTTSPQNIDVEIIAPSLIDSGKPVELEVIITNRNTTSLEAADLVIDYPEGSRSPNDPTRTLTHERVSIGTIQSGAQIKRTISAIFYGGEGSTQSIHTRLEYSVSGSNSVFEKPAEATITIGSAPISLSIESPAKATAGTPFTMTITVRSNAAIPVEEVAVEAQFPFGFTVTGSQPAIQGSLWRLGTMQPGDTEVIKLTGSIQASDGDERVFRFLVGANHDQTDVHVKVPFIVVPQTLTVERAFVTTSLSLESKTGASVSVAAGKTVSGVVNWENNLPDAIANLELSLAINGPAVDTSTIKSSNGFYQSSNSSLIWSSNGENQLTSVPPGGKGSFSFSFTTYAPGANGTLITNPTVTLNLSARGTRQVQGAQQENVASASSMKVVLASALTATAQTFRNSGPFANGGPLPPRAEQESSYTITWTIKNSANTVANTNAQTVLPPYVKFIRGEGGVTYEESSRTVKWALGDVKAGAGYTLPARTASFQVVINPSTSQVGTTPHLTEALTVTGQDRFAQITVETVADKPTINAEDLSGMDTVQPK